VNEFSDEEWRSEFSFETLLWLRDVFFFSSVLLLLLFLWDSGQGE